MGSARFHSSAPDAFATSSISAPLSFVVAFADFPVAGFAGLMARAQIPEASDQLLHHDLVEVGAVHVHELAPEEWEALTSWKQ